MNLESASCRHSRLKCKYWEMSVLSSVLMISVMVEHFHTSRHDVLCASHSCQKRKVLNTKQPAVGEIAFYNIDAAIESSQFLPATSLCLVLVIAWESNDKLVRRIYGKEAASRSSPNILLHFLKRKRCSFVGRLYFHCNTPWTKVRFLTVNLLSHFIH